MYLLFIYSVIYYQAESLIYYIWNNNLIDQKKILENSFNPLLLLLSQIPKGFWIFVFFTIIYAKITLIL